ncbi:Cobalamin (vitamin B12) biosynthesis CobS,cobalamin-5-phosphate synthase [Moorella glycerini]|uniref:Adenosylcobinamide-GDP ribazoletransferase n=1 Tax=Neomoorella stamsii TaxID=1266720 RepID=A0A9X7J1D3_9FIRM|nr:MULTISPECIES: adenosylcobinamide-GDP ribazoletransferase [Moorella]PRR71469.1 Cobalamin synthase [Moorella stamsii]CEP68678.1 Cobalamin (vitamin B12) biosynthesis CobS,cobalamin-5-phosphate synthase [Moorella glycerini]
MKGQLNAFLTALQFLTRIRLSYGDNSPAAFQQSVAFFPLVGLLLGIILAGAWQVLSYLVPATARAGLVLALAVFLSGGLHLDGFIDSMDGLFSGRERERILAIMKDSHVGAHGVTAVVTLLVVKYSLLTALPPGHLWLAGLPLPPLLVLMPVLSRWAMVPALTCFPYARKEGVGTLFQAGRGRRSLSIATLITALLSWLIMGLPGLVYLLLVALVSLGWCGWVRRLLGGLTGDTYGALAEITEVFILAAYFFWHW